MALKTKCQKCGNEFLIIDKEIGFYKEKDFPLPKNCPTCRLERRMALRNKKELFGYNCDKCGKDIIIAFDPPEDQEVYCKECYQAYMQQNDCILGYSEEAKRERQGSTENFTQSVPTIPTTSDNQSQEVKNPIDW